MSTYALVSHKPSQYRTYKAIPLHACRGP